MRRRPGYACWMDTTSNTPERPNAHPASLGWRLLALTYDCLPMIPLVMIISAAFLWLNGGKTVEQSPGLGALELLVMWLLAGAYFVLSWRRGGQTVGMRPWRLMVLAADGKPASWGKLCLRYLVAWLTPGVCLLWTLLDAERRGLHDLAANTMFVRLGSPKPAT